MVPHLHDKHLLPPPCHCSCHTQPVWKPIDTKHFQGLGQPLTLVPVEDPVYARLPWARMGVPAWAAALCVGPLLGAALVGAIWSLVAARRSKTAPQHQPVAMVEAVSVSNA
jgi:hypothetical protein